MNINIYKALHRTTINEEDDSFTLINPEVKNLYKVLRLGGYSTCIVSSSDIQGNPRVPSDVMILINGRLYHKGDALDARVDQELREIKDLYDKSKRRIQVVTDWKIFERNKENLRGLNFELLTQTPLVPTYVEYEKMFLVGSEVSTNSFVSKKDEVVYIGNSRAGLRDDDLEKYLVYSGVPYSLYGNWDKKQFPESHGRLPFAKSQETISQFKFGLCLTELDYVAKGHRTPRLLEYFRAGTVAFVDYKYPRDKELVSDFDFRVVHDGVELREKVALCKRHPEFYERLIRRQFAKIQDSYLDGSYILNKLNGVLDGRKV